MKYTNHSVYDDDDFFKKYTQKRAKGNSPNDTIEKPIVDELIGEVEGKEVLDMGCGDGLYGKELMEKGAKYYHGIDGSLNMVNLANSHLKNFKAIVEQIEIDAFEFPVSSYDLVISRLVLHYLKDLEETFNKVSKTLRENGSFIFSVEHPVITSCYDAYHQKTKRGNWIVDNYFDSGERSNIWIEKEVVKYHRTLEEYFQLIKRAGFIIEELRESKPQRINFSEDHEYERRLRIPLFLLLKLKKKH